MDFESFYKKTFQKVYKFFHYKSVETSVIEDLTHDSFLRFYQKYSDKSYDDTEALKILYGIVRNVYREWVRKSINEKRVPLIDNLNYEEEDSVEFAIFEDNDYEDRLFKRVEELKDCISELNEKIRKVLEYRFLEGKSRKEVAILLNISEKDVHTYQKRGIKYLKKIVESRGKTVPS